MTTHHQVTKTVRIRVKMTKVSFKFNTHSPLLLEIKLQLISSICYLITFKEQILDNHFCIEKNPFTQRRQTAGQSNFDDKKNENDDSDSDDFDEFYNKNTLDIQNLGDTGKKMQNTFGASNDNQGVSILNRVGTF